MVAMPYPAYNTLCSPAKRSAAGKGTVFYSASKRPESWAVFLKRCGIHFLAAYY